MVIKGQPLASLASSLVCMSRSKGLKLHEKSCEAKRAGVRRAAVNGQAGPMRRRLALVSLLRARSPCRGCCLSTACAALRSFPTPRLGLLL